MATFSPVQSSFKVVVSELLYCPGCVESAGAEQVSRNKAACTTNSLTPHFFSHLTIVMIPIKGFRCPHIIGYAFYTITYPIDSIKLTQWTEITNATGIQLPAQHISSFPQTPEAGCDPLLTKPTFQVAQKLITFCLLIEKEEANRKGSSFYRKKTASCLFEYKLGDLAMQE